MKKANLVWALLLAGLTSVSVHAVQQRDYHKAVIGKDCKVCHDQGLKQYLQMVPA